jgi:hypothetical protein
MQENSVAAARVGAFFRKQRIRIIRRHLDSQPSVEISREAEEVFSLQSLSPFNPTSGQYLLARPAKNQQLDWDASDRVPVRFQDQPPKGTT